MLDVVFETLYSCFGGLQHSVLQPLLPWMLSESINIGARTFNVIQQVIRTDMLAYKLM